MTEHSWYWAGTSTGDAGPYTDDAFSDLWRQLFQQERTTMGVIRDYLNELAVTGVTSPVAVDTGLALVDGKPYYNDASANVVIPTPSSATRIDCIVLRKDWTAQTVRLTRIAGSEGGGAPTISQSDGTTWDVKLAQVSITTGGVCTVIDSRSFAWSPLSKSYADHPIRYVEIECFSMRAAETNVVGDGQGFIRIPAELDGYNLVSVKGDVKAAGTTNTEDIQIRNATKAQDMLSTTLKFASGATQDDGNAVIDTTKDDVSDGDRIWVDVDAVHTTPAAGLVVTLGFQLP
jgi:hypothetical protein